MKRMFALLGTLALGSTLAVAPSNTFVIQNGGIIATLEPHQAYDGTGVGAIINTYETLIDFERNTGKLIPLLATGWKASSDGTTYSFVLRQGVKFHSGNDFTCTDAKYSFHRLLVTNNSSSTAFNLSDSILGFTYWDEDLIKSTAFSAISKAVSCDANNQLVFKLSRRDPLFLMRIAGVWAVILDKKTAVTQGEWDGTEATWKEWQNKPLSNSSLNKTDVGTGAYTMVSRESDQAIFKRFDGYWGEKAKLENVIVKVVAEDASRVLALKNGDADIVSYSDQSSFNQLKGAPGVTLVQSPSLNAAAIMFNQALVKDSKYIGSGKLDGKGIPPNFFTDIHVRRGFAAAFDRQRYIKEILGGQGGDSTMAIGSSLPGYDPSITAFKFDPELAKREFALAWKGQVAKNGFSFEALPDGASNRSTIELLSQTLSKINPKFKLKVRILPQADLYAALGASQVPITINNLPADFPDAIAQLIFFYSSSGTFSAHMHYKDTQTDKAIGELSATTDPAKRAALVRLVGRRAAELVPLIPVPVGVSNAFFRSNLKGFKENRNPYRAGIDWKRLSK